jgi:uncharacterized membrane protein YeaQ/YmgE (transglycosylase-associated protein family)
MPRPGARLALAVVSLLALALYAANVWFGLLNQDEGWYLYAALSSHVGQLPYINFFFTQGPVMPKVYGWLAPLWAPYGVAGGRVLTAILGLTGGVLAALLAAFALPRGRRLPAATLTLAFTVANVYHAYFTTIPKTSALAACLLLGGYLALLFSVRQARAGAALATLAGLLLAAAAGARISLGIALAVTGCWLLAQWRALGWRWFWFGVGGAAGLLLLEAPLLFAAPLPFAFSNTFHAGRAGGGWLFVAGSLARSARGYLPLALFLIALAAWRWWTPRGAPQESAAPRQEPRWPALWLLSFAAIVLLQLCSPYPYDDYQVPAFPLLAAATAALAVEMTAAALLPALAWAGVAAAALAALAAPNLQDWFVLRQDRFWVVKRAPSDLAKLRQVGRWLRENTPADKPLLTTDTYLAVEAQRRVPPGFEMGPFGYFPDLDDFTAGVCHVLNRAGMLRALRASDAPCAAFSGYAFAIGAPAMRELPAAAQDELWRAVAERYALVKSVPDFGQGATLLRIFKQRKPPAADGPTSDFTP